MRGGCEVAGFCFVLGLAAGQASVMTPLRADVCPPFEKHLALTDIPTPLPYCNHCEMQ